MELKLGQHIFDVSTQGLVVAPMHEVAVPAFGDKAVDQGASAIYLLPSPRQAAAVSRFAKVGAPIIAAAHDADTAAACLDAGASAIDAGILRDPMVLSVIEEAGVSVLIGHDEWARLAPGLVESADERAHGLAVTLERARWAEAAGLAPSQIMVEAPPDKVNEIAAYGYPVLIATHDTDQDQGTHVAAAMAGARLFRTKQTRATKRTLSTVSELLLRRGVSAPDAVEFAGTPA